MFGVCVPGRPMVTEFRQVTPKNAICELAIPAQIRELCVTMLQPALPPDHGVAIYWALPPFAEWLYLGQLSLQNPTQIFHSPWYHKIPPDVPVIQLGMSVETTEFLNNLKAVESQEEKAAFDTAQAIAKDLFQFMSSFSKDTGQYQQLGDVLIIPTNCIDRWFDKFMAKHRADPFFWTRPKG